MAYLHDKEPTVFGLGTQTKRLTAFVNSYPVIWLAQFVLYAKACVIFGEGLVLWIAYMITGILTS